MFNIAICDDNQVFIDYEKNIINNYLDMIGIKYKINTFSSSESFLNCLSQISVFDLIFLDVEMPGIDGVEIAKQIRIKNSNVKIVFVSAFIDYSTVGYTVNAFRYILKKSEDIKKYLLECLDSVLTELSDAEKVIKLNFSIGEKEIRVNDILYVESHINNVVFTMACNENKEILQVRSSLKSFNEIIEPLDFISISSKYTVNLKHISKISRYEVLLDNGKKLTVSQKKYNEVYESFMLFEGKNL